MLTPPQERSPDSVRDAIIAHIAGGATGLACCGKATPLDLKTLADRPGLGQKNLAKPALTSCPLHPNNTR